MKRSFHAVLLIGLSTVWWLACTPPASTEKAEVALKIESTDVFVGGSLTISITAKNFTLVDPGGSTDGHDHEHGTTTDAGTTQTNPTNKSQGHYHIYIDNFPNPQMGWQATFQAKLPSDLKEGEHTIRVELTGLDHLPLNPKVESTAKFTVKPLPQGCQVNTAGPADEFLYVVSKGTNGIAAVVDPRTCKVTKNIPVGKTPSEGNPSPDGRYIFISVKDENKVAVIDTKTNELAKKLDVGEAPVHTFFGPDAATIWIGNDNGKSVSAMDAKTLEVKKTIETGDGHHKMAFTSLHDGNYKVYVSNIKESTIAVIDFKKLERTQTIKVGASPHGMYYASASKQVYNCSGNTDANDPKKGLIDVIATEGDKADTVVKQIKLDARCGYISADSHGAFLWATVAGATADTPGTVVVIDAKEDKIVATIPVGKKPDKLAYFDKLGLVAVANVNEATVSVIDVKTYKVVKTIAVGAGESHRAMVASLDGIHAYVPNVKDSTISILNIQEGVVRGVVKIDDAPAGMVVVGSTGSSSYPHYHDSHSHP